MNRLQELCPDFVRRENRPGGWRWTCCSAAEADVVDTVGRCTAEHVEAGCDVKVVQLKRHRELLIVEFQGRSFFSKRIRSRDPADVLRETLRLTGDRFGFKGAVVEATHVLLAEKRHQRVPCLHALGERSVGGLVMEQMLIFEALEQHRTLIQALEQVNGDREAQRDLLERTFALVLELLGAGLAHLDFNAKNVMLSTVTAEDDRVVDMEQLVEVDPGREDVLAFYLGYLYHYRLEEFVAREEYDALALQAMTRARNGTPPSTFLLQAYWYFQKNPLRRRERLRLARAGLGRMKDIYERVLLQPVAEPAG